MNDLLMKIVISIDVQTNLDLKITLSKIIDLNRLMLQRCLQCNDACNAMMR